MYLLVRRWLPAGWRGGLLFGALHLVVVATRADPLRPGNEDFDLVGPGWLSVATFGLATLLHGMAVVAFVNRYSRVLPPATKGARAWTGSLLPAVPVLIVPFVLVPAAIGLGLALILGRLDARGRVAASRRFLVGGRLALAAVAIVLMPGTLVDLYDLVVRPA
ncbi:MAG: hypothetical protein ACRD0M_08225 [Acidimicrobiales bacterium]